MRGRVGILSYRLACAPILTSLAREELLAKPGAVHVGVLIASKCHFLKKAAITMPFAANILIDSTIVEHAWMKDLQ